ncbi:alpha/beta hydrolase [Variovorax ginsengisoli]|uniref:Alpha/beta hydrolase n=1 Tax=Variovorax ginsengisoli TaxID=363844 RepID=A0ABT8SEM5_9BURK|nr:alpha/beta hydrolase [Variovorax ginsengisoli]MDN8618206.1 alpha/beta hydrolase [Variovorax ginsengisoli]MDO1537376.1 alpha/beta hydrolase [Variovorax ginsengisoli]
MPLDLPHGFASQQEIDESYNPRLRAVDLNASLQHYVQRSQQAREQLGYRGQVPYGPTLAETLDIVASERPGAPVFFYVHSGYWRMNAARDFTQVAFGAHARGFTTVLVDHALCPQVTLDEIVRQVRSAAAWVIRNIADYGGDPGRIVIGGHSAGAHLGAMLLCTAWREDYGLSDDPFSGAVLVSGLYDIAPLRYSYLQPSIQLDEASVLRNSPVRRVRRCPTPVLLSWGSLEQAAFQRQSTAMGEAWLAVGNEAELMVQPDEDHFTAIRGFEHGDSMLCAALERMAGGAAR